MQSSITTAIVTILLAAALSVDWIQEPEPEPEPRVEDEVLEVCVVDERGSPLAGVEVFLVARPARMAEVGLNPSIFEAYVDRVTTEEDSGEARFQGVDRHLCAMPEPEFLLRLAIPPLEAHELAVSLDPPPAHPVTLVKPSTGEVHIELDPDFRGEVLLRGARVDGSSRRFGWNIDHPCRLEVVGGSARFGAVGLGAGFEVLALAKDGTASAPGAFEGPSRPGQTVTHGARPRPVDRVFHCRLLDGRGEPLRDARVWLRIQHSTDHSHTSISRPHRTDGDGSLRVPVERPWPIGSFRGLVLRRYDADEHPGVSLPREKAIVDLSLELPPGEIPLGDILLHERGSEIYCDRLDDEQLLGEYLTSWQCMHRGGGRHDQLEECLLEMSRRGSDRWVSFLQDELERVRAWISEWDRSHERTMVLTYLTALRRAQGYRDPLVLEPYGGPVIRYRLGEHEGLRFMLSNRDVGGESFPVIWSGEDCSLTRARCRPVARTPDGGEVPGDLFTDLPGQAQVWTVVLEPNDSMPLLVVPEWYLRFPGPGEYSLRVLYHPRDPIWSPRGPMSDAGRIVFSSDELTLRP